MVMHGIEGIIESCYNKGSITEEYTGAGGTVGIGGVVGYNYNGSIKKCYNIGIITTERKGCVGSIVGTSDDKAVKNCYYDSNTSFHGLGTAMDVEKMKTKEFVKLLNGSSKKSYAYDSKCINDGYPILKTLGPDDEIGEEFDEVYEDEYYNKTKEQFLRKQLPESEKERKELNSMTITGIVLVLVLLISVVIYVLDGKENKKEKK